MVRHRVPLLDVSGGEPLAIGVYDLERGVFKATHQFKFEQPKIGEQLTLTHGRPPNFEVIKVLITEVNSDPENEGQVIYAFSRE